MASNKLGEMYLAVGADTSRADKDIGKFRKRAEVGISQTARRAGAAMTAMGVAGAAAFGTMAKAAVTFDKGMAEVATLGIEDLDALRVAVQEVSMEFGLNLTDSAKAAYQAISAGATEAQTPKLLADAAAAAVAGVSDLTTSIELGTSVANAYGISFENINQVFDKSAVAVQKGKTEFGLLAASLGRVAPTAAAAGVSLDDLLATVATVTKVGVQTSEVISGIKIALSNIQKPGKDAVRISKLIGIEFNLAGLKADGFGGLIQKTKKAIDEYVEKGIEAGTITKEMGDKSTIAADMFNKMFGSQEAINIALALTGDLASTYTTILDGMNNSQGATNLALERFLNANPAIAFDQLKATVATLAVEIGHQLLPSLIEIARDITPVIKSMLEWVRANPEATASIAKVGAALSGLLIVLGPIIPIIATTQIAFGGMGGAAVGAAGAGGIGALVGILTGPVGLIALLGAVFLTSKNVFTAIHDLKTAKEGLTLTETRLSGAVEKFTKRLEGQGVKIDRTKLAAMTLDEQLAFLHRTVEQNDDAQKKFTTNAGAVASALDAEATAAAAADAATGGVNQKARESEPAMHRMSDGVRRAKVMIYQMEQQAWRTRDALRAMNIEASNSGTGGAPAMAHGGITKGGMIQMNEKGGELAVLPSGTAIIPNDISQVIATAAGRMLGASRSGNTSSNTMQLNAPLIGNVTISGDDVDEGTVKKLGDLLFDDFIGRMTGDFNRAEASLAT